MAANNKRKLPDTPWHVGYIHKDENDPRRHKARCFHFHDQKCYCSMSRCYMSHCYGSSHCQYYVENRMQWEEYLEEMKTEEEKLEGAALDRAALYKKQKREYVHSLMMSGKYTKLYSFRPQMIRCPFCLDRIKNLSCKYCLAEFKVVDIVTDEGIKEAAEKGYFLISAK